MIFLVESFQELMRQVRNFGAAFPEGRNVKRHNIQTVIQIFTELSGLNHLREISVCCSNDSDIRGHRFYRTDCIIRFRLDQIQKFNLHVQGELPDFIQ